MNNVDDFDQNQIWDSYRRDLQVFDLDSIVFTGRVRKPQKTQEHTTEILEYDVSPYSMVVGRYHRKDDSYEPRHGDIRGIELKVKEDQFRFFLGVAEEDIDRMNDGNWIRLETNDQEFVAAHQRIKWQSYPNYAALLQQTLPQLTTPSESAESH